MIVLSLFDGMSCGQIALNRIGIKPEKYYAAEVDKYAIKVTQANYPETIQLGDVTKWREWHVDWSSIDLLIGGSPCQGFSFAGKQLAFDDPRSKLFFVYVDILNHIKSVNPDVKFMLENVRMKKEYLDIISEYLCVEPVFINSALVSAQNRQRYYWANWKVEQPEDRGIILCHILEQKGSGWIKNKGEYYSRDEKSMCLDANYHKGADNHGQRTLVKCGQMVGRKINPETGKRDDLNKKIKTEQRIELRSDNKTNCLTSVQKDNYIVRKKSKTLRVGGAGSPPNSRQNWDNALDSKVDYRKLTPIECERLQTVPDNYTNHVSNTQRYKMLGNGWTVDVIAHIFKQINT